MSFWGDIVAGAGTLLTPTKYWGKSNNPYEFGWSEAISKAGASEAPQPQVLGGMSYGPANPSYNPSGTTTSTNGGNPPPSGNPPPTPPPPGNDDPNAAELYRQQQEGYINTGYGNYFDSLDRQLNETLPGQMTGLQDEANAWATGQTQDVNSQTGQNIADLTKQTGVAEQGQVKTLKDISGNIRNLMNAGNTYLGSMGAGDSSAVNQYAYGLTKLGSQQRGDVMSQTKTIIDNINDRISKVKNIATQETNRVQSELGQKLGQISQWFETARQGIIDAKGKGLLAKSSDLQALSTNIYNQAITMVTNLQQEAQTRRANIESWALTNSTTAKEALAKAQQMGAYTAPQQQYGQIQGGANFAPQGTGIGYGGGGQESYDDMIKRLSGLG
jgi:hypothetical protein